MSLCPFVEMNVFFDLVCQSLFFLDFVLFVSCLSQNDIKSIIINIIIVIISAAGVLSVE